jgi:hypothetical protein
MIQFLVWAAAVGALCFSCAAQQLWKVSNQGLHGAHFTDIPPAVAAASPGDEIWVYYDSQATPTPNRYTAPVITKALRISAFGVGPGSGPTALGVDGPWIILGIPPGQQLAISGVGIRGSVPLPIPAIVALDCQGDVLLENVYLLGTGMPAYAHFERCSRVVLRGCDFNLSGTPIMAIDSDLLLSTTRVTHAGPVPAFPFGYSYPMTTEGVRVINSTVTCVGSIVWGADLSLNGGSYASRAAVVVYSGLLRVGPATVLRGGITSTQPTMYAQGVAVVPGVGALHQDPRSTIVNPPSSPPFVTETMDAVYHDWVVANEAFHVTVAGPPNGFALLALGDWLPGGQSPFGPLELDPLTVVPVELVPLNATAGAYQWTLSCPIGAPVAKPFALQALTLAPGGALGTAIASPLTVGWPHGVPP